MIFEVEVVIDGYEFGVDNLLRLNSRYYVFDNDEVMVIMILLLNMFLLSLYKQIRLEYGYFKYMLDIKDFIVKLVCGVSFVSKVKFCLVNIVLVGGVMNFIVVFLNVIVY